jgi:hypothetical protein
MNGVKIYTNIPSIESLPIAQKKDMYILTMNGFRTK